QELLVRPAQGRESSGMTGRPDPYVESSHGFGEAICGARGFVRWGREHDCDSVVCVTMFFLPVFALKAIHTFNWNGNSCQTVPIRWSRGLFLCAFLRRFLPGPLTFGLIFLLLLGFSLFDRRVPEETQAIMSMVTLLLLGISGLGFGLLYVTD